MADGVQVVFSGLFLFKIAAPFGKKSPHNTFYCIMQAVFMQALRQTPEVCCLSDNPSNLSHPMRFLAFTNTADLPPSCKAGWKIQFYPASQRGSRSLRNALVGHTNRHKNRNDQRQRKQIRPTSSAGGSNCFYLLILHLLAIQYGVER